MEISVDSDDGRDVSLMTGAGGLDIVEVALMGTVHFVVLARNNEAGYIGIEVFDAETGEPIAEAFTDDASEIAELLPAALRDKNPTKGETCIKCMYPYAMGTKTHNPKRKSSKKKRSKKGARR